MMSVIRADQVWKFIGTDFHVHVLNPIPRGKHRVDRKWLLRLGPDKTAPATEGWLLSECVPVIENGAIVIVPAETA